jgi:hypothetical protein
MREGDARESEGKEHVLAFKAIVTITLFITQCPPAYAPPLFCRVFFPGRRATCAPEDVSEAEAALTA